MLRRHTAAVMIFLALTLLLTNPLALHVWNAVEDKQDALLNTWVLAWVGHSLTVDPLNLFNTNIFFPYQNTLAFSELLVPQGIIGLPIYLATANPILSYNLVLLGMLWLNAFAMYLLVMDWTGDRRAGWVAGAIYAFNPFNLGNLAQIQLVSLGWMPLALLYLSRLLNKDESEAQRPRLVSKAAILFSIFFVLQSLSSLYYALLSTIAVLIYLGYWAISGKRLIRKSDLIPVLFSFLLILVVLLPFVLPYLSVQKELGFQRRVEESEPFSASLKQFTEVSPNNVLYGRWLAPNPVKFVGGYPLDNLFPGMLALILATLGLSARRIERWYLLVLLIIATLLAFGPRLYLSSERSTGVLLPYRWLYDQIGLLRALRAPVRFDALVMFSLAGLAGFGADGLVKKVSGTDVRMARGLLSITRATRASALSFGALSLVAIEYLAVPAANISVVPVGSDVPAVYRWLATQKPGVTVELPMMGPDAQGNLDLSDQYFTTYHWEKTPDGYSGFVPPRRGEIAYEMSSFPSPRSVSLLQALDVQYVVVHTSQLKAPSIPDVNAGSYPALSFVQQLGDSAIYNVAPAIGAQSKLTPALYLPEPAGVGQHYTGYLILSNSASEPLSIKPTEGPTLKARWADGRVEELSPHMPLVTSRGTVLPLTLHAPMTKGKWELSLSSASSVLGAWDLYGNVEVGEESAQETVVPARFLLTMPLAADYARGETVRVNLVWEALNKVDAYYSVSVRLVDEKGNKFAAIDRQPRVSTFLWRPEQTIEDEFDLPLSLDLKPGTYRVQLLMYAPEQDTTVLLLDDGLAPRPIFTLGEFLVK